MSQKPAFTLSADASIVRTHVRNMLDQGEREITYAKIADHLGRTPTDPKVRTLLRGAVHWVERQQAGLVFAPLRGIGYRVRESVEAPVIAQEAVSRTRNASRRGIHRSRSLAAASGEPLNEEAQARMFVAMAQLSAAEESVSARAAKTLAARVRHQSAEIPSAEAFRAIGGL